jgi:solute carrier family 13 (sodium-dependent dicarboxylate transporter), member 2/3/5
LRGNPWINQLDDIAEFIIDFGMKSNNEVNIAQHTVKKDKPSDVPNDSSGTKRLIGMGGGLLLFFIMLLSSPPEGLSQEGWYTAAIAVLMAVWWTTEVIPIPATALLPLVLFPIFNIAGITAAAAPYANPMIFLFLGGFILAIGMQEWNLHRRIALNIIYVIGSKPKSIILGFMISTAFMSMWVSNTAATMMMLPIALSVIQLTKNMEHSPEADRQYNYFGVALMLSIAFAANVGGLGTVIGTPTNALLIGFVHESYGVEISFLQWMMVGIPLVVLGMPVMFYSLTFITFPLRFKSLPGGKEYIAQEVKNLGRFSRGEIMVAIIFTFTAILWMTRPLIETWLPGLSDAGIAIFGALLLFLTPINLKASKFLLEWKAASKLPWGILILFGGGLTLAGAIQRTGLAEWIGGYFNALSFLPFVVVIFIVTLVVISFTNLASNSATAAAFLPVMGSVAIGMGENPLQLAIPVAVAASCAFVFPVGTPPNAIVYGSGVMTMQQMAKAGLWLNLFFTLLITLLTRYLFFYFF